MCGSHAQFQNPINIVMRNCMITDYFMVKRLIQNKQVKFNGMIVKLSSEYSTPDKIEITGVNEYTDGVYGILSTKHLTY